MLSLSGFLHLIDTSIHGVRLSGTDFRHHLAEVLGIDSSEDGRETFLKLVENVRSGQFETRFIVFGESEHLEESFLFRRMSIESAVVFLNLLFLFLGEPITLARFQFELQLGIKLRLVYRRTINRLLHLDAEETSASRLVRQ